MAPVTPETTRPHLSPARASEYSKMSKVSIPSADIDPIYDRLIHEAPYIPGDQVEFESFGISEIPWIDLKLVRTGQEFVSRNFFSLICAHLGALLYGFSFKSLSTLLLRTGNSSNVEVSLIRYLSTFIHLKTWYELDVTAASSDGYADVQRVKKMHSLALKQYRKAPLKEDDLKTLRSAIENPHTRAIMEAVRSDMVPVHTSEVPDHLITYFPIVPMSQFDMVMTQFGIISLVYLFPGALGIRDSQGIDGFLHLWAILGKLLGIHDRFNLALYPSEDLYLKIFTNIGISCLKSSDMIVIHLQQVLVEGVAKYARYTTHKSLLYFGLSRNHALDNYTGQELRRLMTWNDFACYWLMRSLLGSVYNFPLVRRCVNYVARKVLAHASEKYLKRNKRFKEIHQVQSLPNYTKIVKQQMSLLVRKTMLNYYLAIGTLLLFLIAEFNFINF